MCGFRGIKAWVSGWGEVGGVPTDSKCPFAPVLAPPQGPHAEESSPGSGRIWSLWVSYPDIYITVP